MSKGWGKIAIGVRSGSAPDPYFFRCWTRLITRGIRKSDVVLDPVIELPHHYAANALTNNMLATKADTFLYIDDDMVFEHDVLERLRKDVRSYQYDVCQAMYIQRKPPHYPNCIKIDAGSSTGHKIDPKPDSNAVVQVGVVGLGFTMVRREVVTGLLAEKPANKTLFRWGEAGDSEDAMFCFDAQKAGFTLCTNTGVTAGHRMKFVADWDSEGKHMKLLTRTAAIDKPKG